MEKFEIRFSRISFFLLSLLALAFVVLGIFIALNARNQKDTLIAWSSIILFGLCFLVFLKHFFNNAPRIIVDDEGIEDKSLKVGKILWQDIEVAYSNNFMTNKFISLKLKDADKYLTKTSNFNRKLSGFNKSLGFETLNLNLIGLKVSQKDLLNIIKAKIGDSKTADF